ncbi:MAG: hypothetical protein J0H31_00105, partial [Alphaproteobacteria bacterium]|nr:hypothetical protein [Alphaproteobacteria bacterium]
MFGGQFYPRQPIQFMDGLIAPVIGVGLSGVLTYIGQVSNSGSATNSFTFTNAPIGVAATDRLVVGTLLIRSGTAGRVVTGVTFGGVSATLVGSVALDISGGALWAGIFSLLITSGTTSNIVVSCSGNMNEPSIDIYNLNRLQSTT